MLTFGGVPIGIDYDGSFAEYIRRYVPPSLYYPWLRQSWPGIGTSAISYPTGYYADPPFTLNQLHWPCRDVSRWAYMHFLLNSDSLSDIQDLACENGSYFSLPLDIGNPESGGETITIESMFMLPPTPLSGIRGITGLLQSLYLITLVDVRFFLRFANTGAITEQTLPTAWDTFFVYLVQQADMQGITFNLKFDSISSNYIGVSQQMFVLPYEPLPIVLDAVAYNVGQRIVANYDGSFYSQNYNSALGVYNKEPFRNILSGGLRFSDPL